MIANKKIPAGQLAVKDTSVISCSHAVQTFADSTSYFFGTNLGFAPTTSTNLSRRFEAPFTGFITDFYVKTISQTVTSAEDCVLKINNKKNQIKSLVFIYFFDDIV